MVVDRPTNHFLDGPTRRILVPDTSEQIGFIGLGNMGRPMCLRLLAAGYGVTAFDLAAEPLAEVAASGATTAASAAEVAASADVLLTSLPRPDHVEAVMVDAGALAALRPGSCWVDLTTNRRELVQRLADEAPAFAAEVLASVGAAA